MTMTNSATRTPHIRPFEPEDIPAVAQLFELVMVNGRRFGPNAKAYYQRIFFDSPFHDAGMRSLVCESDSGKLIGFIGVHRRTMVFDGEPISVGVATQLMVDPQWRKHLVGVRLLRRFFDGPQTLSIADQAGDVGRQVWVGLGGEVSLLYSLHWVRPLRPLRYIVSLPRTRRAIGPFSDALRPLAWLFDATASRLRESHFGQCRPDLAGEEVDAAEFAAFLAHRSFPERLYPQFEPGAIQWQLEMIADQRGLGPLHCVVLRDGEGNECGWYAYCGPPAGLGEVVLVGADDRQIRGVLEHLFHHAWAAGVVALQGRMEPNWMQELTDSHCFFRRTGPWTLVHSRQPGILDALHRGHAYFTRLDGEWWIRFSLLLQ